MISCIFSCIDPLFRQHRNMAFCFIFLWCVNTVLESWLGHILLQCHTYNIYSKKILKCLVFPFFSNQTLWIYKQKGRQDKRINWGELYCKKEIELVIDDLCFVIQRTQEKHKLVAIYWSIKHIPLLCEGQLHKNSWIK